MKRSTHPVALLLTLAASLAYVWLLLDRGWIPHDEGMLGETARRVLMGELPHRDFDDMYTGGLSYLNAFAFATFGEQLLSMRYLSFAAFAGWVPLVYYLASRFVGPLSAAGVTLTSVVWSYPNYPAAMASWYNLFLATASVAALFRFLETRRARWLVVAGLLAGLSIVIKVVGLYLVAAAIFTFVFMEQSSERSLQDNARRSGWYSGLVTAAGLGLMLLLLLLIRSRLGLPEFVQFVVPGGVIALLVIEIERRAGWRGGWDRLSNLLRYLGPYTVGLALPLLAFGMFYAAHDGLRDLATGVFVTPFRRLSGAARRPPPVLTMIPAFLAAGVLILAGRLSARARAVGGGVLALFLIPLLVPEDVQGIGVLGWLSISQAIPITVLVGTMVVGRDLAEGRTASLDTQRLMLLTSTLALCSLVRFPWTNPTYFAYVAPLELLAITAIVSSKRWRLEPVPAVLLAFSLVYAITWLTPMMYRQHNDSADILSRTPITRVVPDRAGLMVRDSAAAEYDSLVQLVRTEARGQFILATPDCPEVYFLTGFRNPTRTVFDFFDDPVDRTRRILGLLERDSVNLVVLNSHPGHSPPVARDLSAALAVRFPEESVIGRFTVRWRR